jgi:hypothetical protein
MKTVSKEYIKQMNKIIRNRSYVEIDIISEDDGAKSDSKFTDNGRLIYSSDNDLDIKKTFGNTYATLEFNRWFLDGSQEIYRVSSNLTQGFVSNEVSNENGEFTIPPKITRVFSQAHNIKGISLRFDSRTGEVPRSVSVDFYYNNILVDTLVGSDINTDEIAIRKDLTIDKMEIKVIKTIPYRRARIEHVWFGIAILIKNENINKVSVKSDIDPISRRLPIQTLNFSLIDFDRKYDFENPVGIFYLMNLQIPTSVRFGYELDDKSVYWLDEDNYFLTSTPKLKNGMAKFKCEKRLSQMNDIFYKGVFNENKSLTDLIYDVASDAGINESEFVIDEELNTIYTSSALPTIKQSSCLHMIAFAGRCTIFSDYDNKIHFKRFDLNNLGNLTKFKLDYNTIKDKSIEQSKTPFLEAIETFNYSNNEETETIVLNQIINQTDPNLRTYRLFLSIPASNLNITVSTGEDFDHIDYSQLVIITLSPTIGEKTIIITGNPINYQSSFHRQFFLDGGEVERIENILITDENQRQLIEKWVINYLQLRDTFDAEYRGNPEIECGDLISARSYFSDSIKCLILIHEINFDGSLSGSMKIKKISELPIDDEEWISKRPVRKYEKM